MAVAEDERRTWWMFRGRFFWEDDGLGPDEVRALVHERERRRRRRIDRAEGHDARPTRRPDGPRREADPRGRAARGVPPGRRPLRPRAGATSCSSSTTSSPSRSAGASTPANLQLLCAPCNREKGAAL